MTNKIRHGILGSIFLILFLFTFSGAVFAEEPPEFTFHYQVGETEGAAPATYIGGKTWSSGGSTHTTPYYSVILPSGTTAITGIDNDVALPYSNASYALGVARKTIWSAADFSFADSDLIHDSEFTTESTNNYWYFYDALPADLKAAYAANLVTNNVKGFAYQGQCDPGISYYVVVQLTDNGPYTGQTGAGDYTISTAAQLAKLADAVNNSGVTYEGATFTLTENIDFAVDDTYGGLSWTGGSDWTPIGNSGSQFAGTFDGNGHILDHIKVNATSSNAGLFSYLATSGTIKNLVIGSGSFDSTSSVLGAIAGRNYGTITHCLNQASVTSTKASSSAAVGGIVGNFASGTISDCANTGTVTVTTGALSIGGIIGQFSGSAGDMTIENCYNSGDIVVAENARAGGIAGYVNGSNTNTIKNCYNAGNVTPSTGNGAVYGLNNEKTLVLNNNYFLKTNTVNSDFGEETDISAVSDAALKAAAMLDSLGDAYKADFDPPMNSGYPLLAWQEEAALPDKAALEAAIGKVTGDNADNYYQSDDRWNGTDTSDDGFWADMQPYLEAAQTVEAITRASQTEVDAAEADLTAAIAKLMPKTKVNATLLHERVNSCVDSNLEAEDYTTKTWIAYNLALTEAQSVLNGLYGFPGSDDVAKQPSVDSAYDKLSYAYLDLFQLSSLDLAQDYYDIIHHLNKLFRLTEEDSADYTADSWAAYIAARDAAKEVFDNNPINEKLTGHAFRAYRTDAKAYYLACYQLVSSADAIEVNVHVADNLGAKYSQYAITDNHTAAAYNDTVTLTGGSYTLADLITADSLDFSGDMGDAYQSSIYPALYVYINGVCVKDPYDGSDLENSAVYLKDGDKVTFVRAERPMAMYYVNPTPSIYNGYKDFLSVLTIDSSEEVIEVEEGESFSLTVNKASGKLTDYPAFPHPFANVSLVYSNPAESEDAVTGAINDSGAVTDSEGKVSYALYQAGWYLVSAVDTRDQTRGSVGMDSDESGGVFPNLAAGDSILVHVVSLGDAELAAALDGYQDNLDALLAQYSEEEFGAILWKQAQSVYYTAKGAVYASDSLAGAQAALDDFEAALDDLKDQAQAANAKAIGDFSWYLDRLPTVEEIDAGLFTQGDINYYQLATATYDSMSAYQKGQITKNQITQYQALIAAYGEDGSTLPEAQTYTLTLQCNPSGYGDKVTPQIIIKSYSASGVESDKTVYSGQDLSSPLTYEYQPGGWLRVYVRTDSVTEGYEIYKTDWEGSEVTDDTTSNYYFRGDVLNCPHGNTTVTFFVRQEGELTLDEAKDAAKEALTAKFGIYDNAYYTSIHWSDLVQAYKDGLVAIAAATSNEDVDTAKTDAMAAMAAVPERDPGTYGSVKVEFYNNTYADGLGYDETEPFISETMELNADDTMMSVALRAAHEEGYSWEGTGGSGYDIAYLGSISKDGQTLSEFSNGSASGWMGTLNDWFTSEGLNMFTVGAYDNDHKLRDGDVIKIMYTSTGYGEDLGGSWSNGDTSLKALSVDGLTLLNDFSPTTLSYVATVDSSLFVGSDISVTPTAANKNFQVRTFLNAKNTTGWYRPGETIPAKPGDIIYIGIGDESWPTMNSVGAEAVDFTATWYKIYVVGEGEDAVNQLISLIDALPTVDKAALTDQSDIDLAKTYYDNLSESDQADVTNVDKLNDLLQRMVDLQEVVDIKTAITALPAADAVTEDDADAINEVFDTYTALEQWQKNLITVSYTDKLNAVKDAIDLLTGDPATIVINLINALPAADQITLENQDAVAAARTAYDALSEEKQNEVTSTVLNKLIAAEKAVKALADAAIEPTTTGEVTTLKPEATVANQAANVNLADATVGNLANSAQTNGSGEMVIAPKNIGDANPITLTLSKAALSDLLGKTTAKLTIATPLADVTLSNAALAALNAAGDGPITITIDQTADDTIKVTTQNGDTVLTDLGNMIVVIAAAGINENTVVAQINADGSQTIIKDASIVSNLSVSDVTVSPKYSVRVPVTGSVTLQLINNDQTFTDINGHWAAEYIEFVAARGLMQGTGNDKFSPNVALTRGMLVTILWRLDGEADVDTAAGFSDVAAGSYYAKAVDWAKEHEIVNGVGSGKFNPDGNISRQDMVSIMSRYAAYLGMDVTADTNLLAGFSDFDQVSEYAQEAFAWAYQAELVNGTSSTTLSPTGTATRAQFAAVLERFITFIGN